MLYKNQTALLIKSYENAIAWGGSTDHEESLQNAVKAGFPNLPDEDQAELYTRIADEWEGYHGSLAPRKLWIGTIVNKFMASRVAWFNAALGDGTKREEA